MGAIRVGTASWTDKTLLASGWYPADVTTPEERLQYYASQFPLVEVDATYYSPPAERTAELWAQRTPADFTFNIKAYSLLTQHPTRAKSLYKEIRPDTTKNVYLKDLDDRSVEVVWERFLSALDPLAAADKLGAILFQFPQWFPIGKTNKHYILECKRRCEPYRICVEFRNRTWMSEENAAETVDFLRSYAIPYVCVDMPQGFPSSIPPVLEATSDLAVVRFHGHNDDGWESRDIYKRFGYLYDEKELQEWAPKVEALAEQAGETHVLLNNCYRNYAQVNARQLADLLVQEGAAVVPPAPPQA